MNNTDDVSVEIAPNLLGHITPRGLIEPKGTLEFRTNYSKLVGPNSAFFCRLASKNYLLEIGHDATHFYIMRNSDKLEMPLRPIKTMAGNAHMFATWALTELSLTIVDDTYYAIASKLSEEEKSKEIEKRRAALATLPTIPPNSLLLWARKQAILETIAYESYDSFYGTVASSLEAITDPVSNLGSVNSFWDIAYQASRIIGRRPKRETDIHPTIHNLLFYLAIAKNLEIYREHPISGGRLDFLISGHLLTGENVSVCIEFKYAHSKDLFDGLLKQLPAYMKAKGCNFGIYCVPYFKGPYFEEPKEYDLLGARMILEKQKRAAGLKDIRILMFDLSMPQPPSKL